jgi:hypothetical protein
MSLVRQLANARPSFTDRIGGFSPIATDTTPPRCHAGANHGRGEDHGAAGVLCTPCYEWLCSFLEGR